MPGMPEAAHVPASAGEMILVMTDLVTVKAEQRGSSAPFALTEVSTPPGGGPPGLHRHADQETFYVLAGQYRFDTLAARDGDAARGLEAGPGDVVHFPSQVWHNYRNIGQTAGKLLVLLQPGDLLDFFRELGVAVRDRDNLPRPAGPPDPARVLAITQKHQVEMYHIHKP